MDGRLLGRLPHGNTGLPPVLPKHARRPGHRIAVSHLCWLDVDHLDAQILSQLLHHPRLDLRPAGERAIDEHIGVVVDLPHRDIDLAIREAGTQDADGQDRVIVRERAARNRQGAQQRQKEDCAAAAPE